jgi:hypothetical protein
MSEDVLVSELRKTITEQREKIVAQCNTIADLERHNRELREAVAALLASDLPPSQASYPFGNEKHQHYQWLN